MKINSNYILKHLILVLLIISCSVRSLSQISVTNIGELDKIKSGTMYVAMNDPQDSTSLEYIEIFRNYWSLSEIQFIKYVEISNYISENSSFFTMGGYETNSQFQTLYANGSSKYGIDMTNTHLYLELWTCNRSYFDKENLKERNFSDRDKIQVARIEFFTDFETLSSPENLFDSEYDGEGHIRNWSAGLLKNYLQNLNQLLQNSTERGLFDESINKVELNKLKKTTLYVPNYVLTKFNAFTGDESKQHSEKKLFKHYPNKYQIITMDDLNDIILSEDKSIYYLIYVKSSTDKFITVINSSSGEMIYSKYTPVSYNIKGSDIKAINYE